MRNTFVNTLTAIAETNEKLNLVVGDLGYSVVDQFAASYPEQFLNAGVAEQLMTGLAAGLSMIGERTVVTYSIANFPVIRCLEQIRNDVCFHSADVKIVSVGGGLAYGSAGYTHHAVEDISLMRTMPGMVVTAPADPVEAKLVAHLAVDTPGPWYVRLGKNGEPNLHIENIKEMKIGQAIMMADGDAGTIISTGTIAHEAWLARQHLEAEGYSFRFFSSPFVKPFDEEAVLQAAQDTRFLVTVEEHNGFGGLGSAVAEILSKSKHNVQLCRIYLPDLVQDIGSQQYLLQKHGLDKAGIVCKIKRQLDSE